jgi:predicted ATPase
MGYWHRAAAHAIQRSAYVEALRHLSTARAVLTTLPETRQRTQLELDGLMLLGPVYMATQGYGSPEVRHTYTRARALCHQIGETPQTLPVLLELFRLESVCAHHTTALALGQQCLTLAHHHPDPRLLLEAHGRMGFTLSLLGDLRAARTHMEHALALSQTQASRSGGATQDTGVACLSFLAWTLVALGYQDHAVACIRQAVARAHALAHPFSLVFATHHAGIIHHLRREPQAAYASAETSLHMARTHGFPLFVGANLVLQGWALAMHGRATEALAQMEQGLAMSQATGHKVFYPWNLALMAEAYGQAGQFAAALTVVVEALTIIDTTEERMWEAELHRLKGETCLAQAAENHAVAAACLQQAFVVARRQHAKSCELRAAMSLARLWQGQGKRAEAFELLAPIYDWLTEGFETPDLQDARVLLDALKG